MGIVLCLGLILLLLLLADYHTYNDTALLRRIADGDEGAFSEFFRRYFDQLYQIVLKYTKRHIDAEDIVQTVFVRCWEKRSIFRELESPLNWFFICARNEYLDRWRKNRRSLEYQQYLGEVFSEEDRSPESILANKEYTILHQQAIGKLPEKQQLAYLLSREKGLTYDQIAREMNVERSTVKEHISRANKSIRSFFLSQPGFKGEYLFFLFFLKLLSACFIYVRL